MVLGFMGVVLQRVTAVAATGWEIMTTWDERISVILLPARLAMKRRAAGGTHAGDSPGPGGSGVEEVQQVGAELLLVGVGDAVWRAGVDLECRVLDPVG